MCGRYLLSSSAEIIAGLFQAEALLELMPRYNIAPSQQIPVVLQGQEQRIFQAMRWGLTPRWAKAKIGPRGGVRLPDFINARSETAADKASFRDAIRQRRCLVPADGFYEWKKTEDGKQPHLIRFCRPQVFAMAGIWETWVSPEGQARQGVCILTTGGNAELRDHHDRMPVILHPDRYGAWLNSDNQPSNLAALLQPLPDGFLQVQPVSNRINRPQEDDADLLLPL
jgi:putative SOS response-associated peptidase YedK